jgi:MFS family permease
VAEQAENKAPQSYGFAKIMIILAPLWGFIIYDIYAMGLQLSGIKTDHYWAEIIAVIITAVLLVKTLSAKEQGPQAGIIGFKKILAAHSFSWIGIQTMFVFIFAFLQDKMPGLEDDELGRIISLSFLVLSAVSAVLPALVLEPVAAKIGRIKTHAICISTMAVGYVGVIWFGDDKYMLYGLMAFLGIGWAAVISLPFAIMSEKIEQSRMGLFMGLFNLSVVLPQLLVSLGIGLFISKAADKGLVFEVSAVALAVSAIAWFVVMAGDRSTATDEMTLKPQSQES